MLRHFGLPEFRKKGINNKGPQVAQIRFKYLKRNLGSDIIANLGGAPANCLWTRRTIHISEVLAIKGHRRARLSSDSKKKTGRFLLTLVSVGTRSPVHRKRFGHALAPMPIYLLARESLPRVIPRDPSVTLRGFRLPGPSCLRVNIWHSIYGGKQAAQASSASPRYSVEFCKRNSTSLRQLVSLEFRDPIHWIHMTISVAETALDREAEAMKRCVWRTPLRNWLTWIYCVVFLASFTGFYVFWYTNTYHGFLLTRMVLRNGTQVYDWWQDPPFNCTCNIYLFNYTNVDDFEAGRASKLHVQELGPYSYSEKTRRVNVMMHENGTVSFQLIKTYQWIGGRPEDDVIMVPNVPLMFATAFVRDLNFAMRFSLSTVLSTLQEKPFINVTAGGYSWGYDNPLFEMAKPLLMFQQDIPFDKFGLLAMVSSLEWNLYWNNKIRSLFLMYNDLNKSCMTYVTYVIHYRKVLGKEIFIKEDLKNICIL